MALLKSFMVTLITMMLSIGLVALLTINPQLTLVILGISFLFIVLWCIIHDAMY